MASAARADYTVAFASSAPLNTDIFIADADGSNAVALAPHPARDYNAKFTEDGYWVLFTSERAGSADIYRVRTDGTDLERLTDDPAYDDQAALAPDARRLAFVSTRSGNADIWILDLANGELRNVTNHPGGDFRPAWSSDGQWLAFSSDRDSVRPRAEAHSTEVYVMRADGSGVRRLSYYDGAAGTPAWAPNGKSVVFYAAEAREIAPLASGAEAAATTQIIEFVVESGVSISRSTGMGAKLFPQWRGTELAYYDRSGQGALRLEDGVAAAFGEFRAPDWSPDGTRLVFGRETGGESPPFTRTQSREPEFALLRTGTFAHYSPDGRRVAMSHSREGLGRDGVWVMSADGSGGAMLFADPEHGALAPAWSADGARLAFGLEEFFPTAQGFATSALALLDVETRAVTRLTAPGDNAGFPSWSPDGRRIVFRKWTDEASSLHILDLEENTTTALLENFGSVHYPAWSPDSSVIQFTSDRGGHNDLYTIDPESRQIEQLTNAPGHDGHGSWSPDGEWIAFLSVRGGYKDEAALNPGNPRAAVDLYVMRADGSDVRVLTENPFEEATPAWAPLAPRTAEAPPPPASRFKLFRRKQ